ncbi:serine/threonine protein kinase [Polyangium aurulentum]|uniref:serine/threonine protein kinase n=1 Tax=Polyangium aurulentum TaxID=2567896 RepID=UPI0010AEBE23|nr:serine/threonine-protein kinase [Polyangium aurulentum]UQA59592.1 protein kinase [Polyangium aurulentum]
MQSIALGPRFSLGKYRLIAEIGRGGMADIFLAAAEGLAGVQKMVVLKVHREDDDVDGTGLVMFLDEARLVARLGHPNVVQAYEAGCAEGQHFIAMEFLDGQPLHLVRQRLPPGEGLPMAAYVRLLADVLAGLHHAHELEDFDGRPLGVVHRDVTPHNVFVTYDGHAKVMDFGVAKAVGASTVSQFGEVKGKLAYMSPEQVRGEPVDRRTDVFAVGVMLWELVAGRRLWKGVPELVLIRRLGDGEIPDLREVCPDAPANLARVIARAMAPRAEDRHPTALAMAMDLEACLEGPEAREAARVVTGVAVAGAFAEERAKLRALAREAMAPASGTRIISALPNLGASSPFYALTDSVPPPSASGPVMIMSRGDVEPAPVTARAGMPLPETEPGSARRAALGLASPSLGSARCPALGPTQLARAAVGPTIAARTMPSPAMPAPTPLTSVMLRVHVTPSHARLFMDDELLSVGPYVGRIPRDGRTRSLRVEAPQYASWSERVLASTDITIAVALARREPPPPPSSKHIPRMSSRPVQVVLRAGPLSAAAVANAPAHSTAPTILPPAPDDEPSVPTEPSGRF